MSEPIEQAIQVSLKKAKRYLDFGSKSKGIGDRLLFIADAIDELEEAEFYLEDLEDEENAASK